jgi:predicted nucleic acid-binding protein
LCDIEFASAIRRGIALVTSISRAEQVVEDYLDLPLTRYGHRNLLQGILALGDYFSAYDSSYVVLAETVGARC